MHCSVREMLDRVSAGELTEWRAYFRVKERLIKKAQVEGDVPDSPAELPRVMGGIS